jgi:hypothetical protein
MDDRIEAVRRQRVRMGRWMLLALGVVIALRFVAIFVALFVRDILMMVKYGKP